MARPFGVRNLASSHISYGRTWLQNRMSKFPLEPQLSRLRPEALPNPSTSLYMTLLSTCCPHLDYASFPLQCTHYMLCWMMHRLPRSHHGILLRWSSCGWMGTPFEGHHFARLDGSQPTLFIVWLRHSPPLKLVTVLDEFLGAQLHCGLWHSPPLNLDIISITIQTLDCC